MPFNIIRDDITKVRADVVVKVENNGGETGSSKFKRGRRNAIHTVFPIWNGGKNGEEDLLYSCYKNWLELAAKNKQNHYAVINCPKEEVKSHNLPAYFKSHPNEPKVAVSFRLPDYKKSKNGD